MAFQFGQLTEQIATTATAAGTTTLTNISKQNQVFTGSNTQTIVLPDATTMADGQGFNIINQSSLSLTLNFNGGSPFTDAAGASYSTIFPHQALQILLQGNAGGSPQPGTWSVVTNNIAGVSLIQPTIQTFLTGSGTYTKPANVAYIEVEMIGGGGGGGTAVGTGGNGGNTTFGTSLLVAGGGTGANTALSGPGGTASLGVGPIGIALTGTAGQNYNEQASASNWGTGGSGGNSLFGGAGTNGGPGQSGGAATPNTGSGGGGASIAPSNSPNGGGGGGSGGYVKAVIANPAATYSYVIGAAGTAGTGGSFIGGAGATGIIVVREFYNQTIASGITVTASTAPTKQTFSLGSGTYVRPSGVQYISIRMVGGGSGGSGSGTGGTGGTSGAGGNTTFGGITCTGGSAAISYVGSAGGTATLGSGAVGLTLTGNPGGPGIYQVMNLGGQPGGSSPFGGSGNGGQPNTQGLNAVPNSGSGGGAGASGGTVASSGSGGSSGGYVDAIINNPAATYAYSIGTGGGGGAAGTSGFPGGNGGSGYIEVTEYYTALATGGFTGGGANVPTIQTFLTGSGTYTKPANVIYIQVEMVGGGGGGGGSSNAGSGGTGGTGGNTTFGTSLLAANGGAGGRGTDFDGGAGGSGSLGSGPIGVAIQGAAGGSAILTGTGGTYAAGGVGGTTPFGGGSGSGPPNNGGGPAVTNTGSGGGGAGSPTPGGGGGGGGAGAYVKAIITNPNATYAYSVATAGTGGAAGTSGFAGGAGGSGIIIVTEYYANGTVGTATNITGIAAIANGGTGANTLSGAQNALFPTWSSYTPAVVSTVGALTSYTAIGSFLQEGSVVFFSVSVSITNNGSGSGALNISLPVNAVGIAQVVAGRENSVTGDMLQGLIQGASMNVFNYNNTYPAGSGYSILVSGSYRVN